MKLEIKYKGQKYELVEHGKYKSYVFVNSATKEVNEFLTSYFRKYQVEKKREIPYMDYEWVNSETYAKEAMELLGAEIIKYEPQVWPLFAEDDTPILY